MTPYRQFCRWRNGNSKGRQSVAKQEQWNYTLTGNSPEQTSALAALLFHSKESIQKTFEAAARNVTASFPRPKVLIRMQWDCYETMRQSPFGTGNWVQMIYLLRLATAQTYDRQVQAPVFLDLEMTCVGSRDKPRDVKSLVLPWLMGSFDLVATLRFLRKYWGVRLNNSCMEKGWGDNPVGWMAPLIRHDLRRMAVGLVGVPSDPHHPIHHRWNRTSLNALDKSREILSRKSNAYLPPTSIPLLPNIELDDTVIHFRCGDIMASNHSQFRSLKFYEFASRIWDNTTSIGIVTQSFRDTSSDQTRVRDQDDDFRVSTCRTVAFRFVDYLQERFPTARIRIRNGPDESVALAFCRLIWSKQSIAYPDSSFSVLPTLASFGVGYHMTPVKSPYAKSTKNQWLLEIRDQLERIDNQLRFIDRDVLHFGDGRVEFMSIPPYEALYAIQTNYLRLENETRATQKLLEWFVNDKFHLELLHLPKKLKNR